ncbi:MAG TPA: hypothetical protein VMK84_04175 [Streptosporangiaceae bacterium]|nr:hypothetical protein [Streptosporangiaceae bacterium]
MAVARVYTVDTNATTGISLGTGGASGTEQVLLFGASSGEFNISAVRVALYSLSSAAYPSNGSITFRLRKVSSTNSGILAGTGTALAVSQSSTAALSTWIYSTANGSGTGTFATMTTAPAWEQTIPCTAGANWGEWFTPGFELNVTNATMALTYTMSNGTVSGVNVVPQLVISE